MKRRCSSVNIIKMTQAQQQRTRKIPILSRLRNSPNLREIVKHIAENSWRLVSPILVCLPKTALFRQLTCNNFVLFTVGIHTSSILTNDKGSDHGKNYEKFFEKLHEKIFSWPWPCSSLWWLGYASTYSCNKITATWIQISRQNWNGFFSNATHQIMI